MVDPPGPPATPPKPSEPADSSARFCADFAALLDARGVSLRAAARSGWGKTTIAAARKGPDLPNVDLVVDVLQTIGEPEQVREQWRDRHARLSQAPISPGPAESLKPGELEPAPASARHDEASDDPELPVSEGTPRAVPLSSEAATEQRSGAPAEREGGPLERDDSPNIDEGGAEPTVRAGSRRWWSRRRGLVAVVVVVVLVAGGGLTWWLVARSDQPTPVAGRTIVVQNKVAFGPTDLEEDDSPSYLAARPIERCANVPGCKLSGTDMGSGDTVEAVCQLQGALLTNADVQSTGIKSNPNVAASSLWYGIRWPDGRLGYLSEVYVAPMYRGGLQLPPC